MIPLVLGHFLLSATQIPLVAPTGSHSLPFYNMFGAAVAGVGDVDGDGTPDILIGEPWRPMMHDTEPGNAWLLSGRDSHVIQKIVGDDPGDHFGVIVAGPGDLDGDHVPDLLIGAERSKTAGRGYVRAISGKTGKVLFRVETAAGFEPFGCESTCGANALCAIGDVDGDGCADFAIGEPLAGAHGKENGRVRIVSGKTGAVLRELAGEQSFDRFGFSVANAGDVDGDGINDVIAGSPDVDWPNSKRQGPTYVRVHSGKTGALIRRIESKSTRFGISVAGIADLDGDGMRDILVSEAFCQVTAQTCVRAFSIKTGKEIRVWHGHNNEFFGAVVLGMGDLDGDHVPDLFVTALGEDPRQPCMMVLSGTRDDMLWSRNVMLQASDDDILAKYPESVGDTHAGVSAAIIGDLDHDGVDDIIVGAAEQCAFAGLGCVGVFSGRTGERLRLYYHWMLDAK